MVRGLMINKMDKVLKNGRMELVLRESIEKERSVERENSNLQIILHMRETLLIINFQEKGNTFGMTKGSMLGNGKIIR